MGVINTYSGPLAAAGEQMERGIKLYMKLHEKDLPPGVTIELIRRDDTGPNPEVAKRLAQELITRDKVSLLTGVVWTPNALAMAPLLTEAKMPFVIMNAGTAIITTKSPYIARVSFTLWQSSYPMGAWAAKNGLKLGICGEHGGDPASIAFCEQVGLDYVSCSPYRVPVARLAAAQAALGVSGDRTA